MKRAFNIEAETADSGCESVQMRHGMLVTDCGGGLMVGKRDKPQRLEPLHDQPHAKLWGDFLNSKLRSTNDKETLQP